MLTMLMLVILIVEPIYKGFLDRLPEALEEKLTDLNYIPGSFNLEEAISVLGIDIEWERLENKIVWILFKILLLIKFFCV